MTPPIALVTGATGLLGNNLVKALQNQGFAVRALVRSRQKALDQNFDPSVELIEGDLGDVSGFSSALQGVEVVFHTAAYFRESYKGGRHWEKLYNANVRGTRALLQHSYKAGVRRFVHTSSIAVLTAQPGELITETMLRPENEADDYYRSKILSDREVLSFLEQHPDMWAVMVLPGWMHGPGDIGPTSAGQTVLDFMRQKIPGIPPGSFSVVDARDVAQAMIAANQKGLRGERYLMGGQHMSMGDIFGLLEKLTGISAPTRRLPFLFLYPLAMFYELLARITAQPVLLSWATVQLMRKEADCSHYSHVKTEQVLGVTFRPVEETLRDEVQWYHDHGWMT